MPLGDGLISLTAFYKLATALVFAAQSLVFAHSSHAQDLSRYVKHAPPEPWVIPSMPGDAPHDTLETEDVAYLLVDNQYRFTDSQRERYTHFVELLQTPDGVEENSTFKVAFEPDFQRLTLHHLDVIRDGVRYDRLDLTDMQLYREETDRQKLIFNGNLELGYILPDIRPGDILDYAYTRTGKNPAIGPHAVAFASHQYRPGVAQLNSRLLFAKNMPVKAYGFVQAPDYEEGTWKGYKTYTLNAKNVDGKTVDKNSPDWHLDYPVTQFTTFKDWAEVGAFLAPAYNVSKLNSSAVKAIAADIEASHSSDKTRARAALDYVQREIRYLGIEIGAGGYIPRDPDRVLRRRYGDCKDMTRLLNAILHELDITAMPLLVDFDTRGGLDKSAPRHNRFDHVITLASVDGIDYYLDATKGEQLGDLDNLQQGLFFKGVIIAPKGSTRAPGMIDAIPQNLPEYWADYVDTYTLEDGSKDITFKNVSTYYQAEADSMYGNLQNQSQDALLEDFVKFYQDFFPTIESVGDMEVDIDEAASRIRITTHYKIPGGLQYDESEKAYSVSIWPFDLNSAFPNFDGASRTLPASFSHPTRIRQKIIFELGEGWDMDMSEQNFDMDAFTATETKTHKNGVYTEIYTYKTKADFIAAQDYAKAMAAIDDYNDEMGTTLTVHDSEDTSLKSLGFTLLLAIVMALGFRRFAGRKQNA